MSTPEDESVKNEDDHSSGSGSGSQRRVRRSKACKQCHSLKVRCIPIDGDNPLLPCVRCVKLGKPCEMDAVEPLRKKRAIKTEVQNVAQLRNRIAELQEQVEALRSGRSPAFSQDSLSPPFMTKTDLERELNLLSDDLSFNSVLDQIRLVAAMRSASLKVADPVDVVSLGIISMDDARDRLEKYRSILFKNHLFVAIPDECTAESLLKHEPYLFNTIMAVTNTVCRLDANLQVSLELERHSTTGAINEALLVGTKSSELIKCFTLMSVWYNTPEFFKTRRFHMLNNIAVTLIHDLGIVGRTTFSYSGETKMIHKSENIFHDAEYRAMVLTLFSSTVGFCLILRRVIFVKWTPYVEECCEFLERGENEVYRDVALFARLNHELETIHHTIHLPEAARPHTRVLNYTLSELANRLEIIRARLKPEQHILMAYSHSVEAYLHQPLSEELLVKSVGLKCTDELSSRTLATISKCTASCLLAMGEFNRLTEEEIASLPLFHFTRIIYTVGILMRLRYFILSLPSNIEKDLVPTKAIIAILDFNKKMSYMMRLYPLNHLLKKMNLILRLFVQTYVTQVNELLLKSNDGSNPIMTRVTKKEFKDMNHLAQTLLDTSQGNLSGAPEGPGLHLDLLSYVASEHRKSTSQECANGKSGDDGARSISPTKAPPINFPPPIPAINVNEPPSNNSQPKDLPGRGVPFDSGNIKPPLVNEHRGNHYGPFVSPRSESSVRQDYFPASHPNGPEQPANRPFDPKQFGPDENGFRSAAYEFDDEFWSNLLTTGSDTFHFAQDYPPLNEGILNIFN